MQPVDDLRDQLRSLGYLSHGLERWFALDPWSSRAFWSELLLLALKSATACSAFVAAPFIFLTVWKNLPLGAVEIGWIVATYLAGSFVVTFALVLVAALLFKIRPSLGVESQRFLTTSSMGMGGLLALATGLWWSGFRTETSLAQFVAGAATILLGFVVTSTVFAAALLSFSIHETRKIPATRRRSRRAPLAIGGALLLLALVLPLASRGQAQDAGPPDQVITSNRPQRVALIAVDGLTADVFVARPDLRKAIPNLARLQGVAGAAAPERWASIGTGTPARLHGVRAVEGLRFRASDRVLQSLSERDPMMRSILPLLGLAVRQPLPPTVRQRDFVWEITSSRAVPSVSVNWWTSFPSASPSLISVPQDEIFTRASRRSKDPIEVARAIDEIAAASFLHTLRDARPVLSTVYLPGLDIVLNRVPSDTAARLASSVVLLDDISSLIREVRGMGYEVLVIGLPGYGQPSDGMAASTMRLPASLDARDVAPTLLDLCGFPASDEMGGHSIRPGSSQQRISSYGARRPRHSGAGVDEEYYRSLRSLGYIQ